MYNLTQILVPKNQTGDQKNSPFSIHFLRDSLIFIEFYWEVQRIVQQMRTSKDLIYFNNRVSKSYIYLEKAYK